MPGSRHAAASMETVLLLLQIEKAKKLGEGCEREEGEERLGRAPVFYPY